MRRTLILLLSVATLAALPHASQAQSACRAPDASTSQVLQSVKLWATLKAPSRDSVGLTGVDTARIVSEADSITCARVVQAIDAKFGKAGTAPTSYVIVRAGSRFFAWVPPANPNQESRLLHVLDSLYAYRDTIIAF
ncbi:MAG TPA: hypothetical protein VEB19_10910 [Gemmatimonadaceae bacterium]|nr:hypothetical protein [Gemmatimonadaceae bacterium]